MPGSIFRTKYSFKSVVKNGIILIGSDIVAIVTMLKCVREFIHKNENVAIGIKYIFSYRIASKFEFAGIIPISNADSHKVVHAYVQVSLVEDVKSLGSSTYF